MNILKENDLAQHLLYIFIYFVTAIINISLCYT